VLNKNNK